MFGRKDEEEYNKKNDEMAMIDLRKTRCHFSLKNGSIRTFCEYT